MIRTARDLKGNVRLFDDSQGIRIFDKDSGSSLYLMIIIKPALVFISYDSALRESGKVLGLSGAVGWFYDNRFPIDSPEIPLAVQAVLLQYSKKMFINT